MSRLNYTLCIALVIPQLSISCFSHFEYTGAVWFGSLRPSQ